jgi:formiminotetrahydrofolate cyclodeaminase
MAVLNGTPPLLIIVFKKPLSSIDVSLKTLITLSTETLNKELTELVDEDSIAFNQVMESIRLPKETEEDRNKRAESIETASQYALKIPLTVAEKCLLILRHQIDISLYGNKNAVSDIGVGALLAFAGLEGAVLNVKINIPGITSQSIKTDAERKVESYINEGERLKVQIINIVNNRI